MSYLSILFLSIAGFLNYFGFYFQINNNINPDRKIKESKLNNERFIIKNENITAHLNQYYYYPEETVWFSLKIGKTSPDDITSKIVYVDIFSENKKNVYSAAYIFNNQISNGSWEIPDDLAEGKYVLRAYTNWMKNFDDSTFSYSEFRVIPLGKLPVKENKNIEMNSMHLNVKDSNIKKGNNISLEIDKCENCKFSLAVTYDVFSNPMQPQERKTLTKIVDVLPEFPMEDEGRVINGNFKDNVNGTVWYLSGKLGDFKIYETDSLGKFTLLLPNSYDSTFFYLKAFNKKNRLVKEINIKERPIHPLKYEFLKSNLPANFENVSNFKKIFTGDETEKIFTLNEVEIKAKKPENTQLVRDRAFIGRPPNISFESKDLNKSSGPNILFSLSTLIPGFNIKYDPENFKTTFSIYNNRSAGLVYDGMEVDPEQISNINADMIGRIDYYSRNPTLIAIYSKVYLNIALDEKKSNTKNDAMLFVTKGIASSKSFYIPTKQNDLEKLERLESRNTIYWNPIIETDATGKTNVSFEAIGKSGVYHIELIGENAGGIVISEKKKIEIN